MRSFAGTFYKVTNLNENHHDFQYRDGENVLLEAFNDDAESSCAPGGLYFTDRGNIAAFLNYGVWIREVTLPWDSKGFKVIADPSGNKFRANKIILGKRYSAYDPDTFHIIGLPISVYEDNLPRLVDQLREEHAPDLDRIYGLLMKTRQGRQLMADRFWRLPRPPAQALFQQLVQAGDFTATNLRKARACTEGDFVTGFLEREGPNVSALVYGRAYVLTRADEFFCRILDSKKKDIGKLKLWAEWTQSPVRSLVVKRHIVAARRARRQDLLDYYSSLGKDISYVEKRWNKGSDGEMSSDDERW
jgi:hypothetical protein